jgi:hypothetical protein
MLSENKVNTPLTPPLSSVIHCWFDKLILLIAVVNKTINIVRPAKLLVRHIGSGTYMRRDRYRSDLAYLVSNPLSSSSIRVYQTSPKCEWYIGGILTSALGFQPSLSSVMSRAVY